MEENKETIIRNKELNIWEAIFPVLVLIGLLALNVYVYGDDATGGPNQFALLIGGAVAAVVGYFNKVEYKTMLDEVGNNFRTTAGAILILLFVGALAGTWLISGIIPSMIYYGLQILNPTIFLPATVIICAVISIATGSSWTTSATVGIALIGIGKAIGFDLGMVAGAVLSGAYFGDKMSPLSDTTNLAPAMAGTDLFTHIRYMAYTTVPTIVVALIIFTVMGLMQNTTGEADTAEMLSSIREAFNITPLVFIVPGVVIAMIVKKTRPLVALMAGTLLGGIFAIIFQPDIVAKIAGAETLTLESAYKGVMTAMTLDTSVETNNAELNDLFTAGGMSGMLGTIWLIMCAMVFGGIMDAIGALARISQALLNMVYLRVL